MVEYCVDSKPHFVVSMLRYGIRSKYFDGLKI